MNTANKLTILRVFMIPVFLLVLYLDVPNANYWALAIFVIASLTDTLDGYIARHYNQTTDFGKFMDPLADKCLVTAAMLWFVEIGQMPSSGSSACPVCGWWRRTRAGSLPPAGRARSRPPPPWCASCSCSCPSRRS